MITVIFWGTVAGGSCFGFKLMHNAYVLGVRIRKMEAFVKEMKQYHSPSS